MFIRKPLASLLGFLAEEEGTTSVEYAVMLAMILLALIGSVFLLSEVTQQSFNESAEAISNSFAN